MLQLPFRLPSRSEATLIAALLFVLLFASWLRRGERIAALEARPAVQESAHVAKHEVVKRGPVKLSRKKTVAPDGTVTTESTREVAGEERETNLAVDLKREETPPVLPRAPTTRWVHGTFDINGYMPRRVAGGLTLWGRVDLGVSYDWRYRATGIEVGLRF